MFYVVKCLINDWNNGIINISRVEREILSIYQSRVSSERTVIG